MNKKLYAVEFTDTIGGEANYCWVQCFRVWASDLKEAVTKAKQHRYHSPLPRHTYHYKDGGSARIDIVGACVCAFVEWTEPDHVNAIDQGEIINPEEATP